MNLKFDSEIPLYIQIAEEIKDGILSGGFPEETQVPSTTEISVAYKINPATVLKGMTLLGDEGILYKRRGIGMFVCRGAAAKIRQKRRQAFYEQYVVPLLDEAKKLGIERAQLTAMLSEQSAGGPELSDSL